MIAVVVILFLFLITIIWMMVVTYRLWKCSGASAFGAIFVCSVLGAVSLLAFGCAIAFGTTNGGIAWGLKFAVVMSVATGFATLVTLSAGILISLFVEYRQTTELLARMKPLDWARGGGPSVRRVTHERTCAGRKAWPIGVACCISASCVFLLYQWPIFSQNPLMVTLAVWLALLGLTIIALSLRCKLKTRKSSFILLSVILVITALVGGVMISRNTLSQWRQIMTIPAVVEVLLIYGADVNATANCGITPLHDAEKEEHTKIAEFLWQYGAMSSVAKPAPKLIHPPQQPCIKWGAGPTACQKNAYSTSCRKPYHGAGPDWNNVLLIRCNKPLGREITQVSQG